MQSILWAATGTGFTFLMTSLGAAMVFLFRKQLNASIQRIFLGFAAGVMIAASMWSLLIPAIEEAQELGLPGWLPAAGVGSLAHFILPSITLGANILASQLRMTRTSMLDVIKQDYIRTARSKGISEFKVIYKHALRNALLPVVTYIGPMVASIVTGSFVIETVFGIPGVGQLFTDSIVNRDYPLIMGITVFFAVLLVLAVLIVDLVYVLIDPRIKLD